MPTLAVIIAAKNAEQWLAECVDSVLGQRVPAGWSVGVAVGIDACPPTLATASQLAPEPNLALRYFPTHVGPYVIYNSLASATRADVLVRFDADDVMLPGYLSEQIAVLDQRLSPRIVRTWSTFVDKDLRPRAALLADGTHTGADGRRRRASDGQFLMTRAVFTCLGGFCAWKCHADSEFLQRARWSRIPFHVVEKFLYLRRVHDGSLTASRMTGYGSVLRQHYAQHVRRARGVFAAGGTPERVQPEVAPYIPVACSA